MSGKVNLQLRNGAIIHLNESTEVKVGFGKFLNILSLQSLPRRLALDFHDIKDEGFPFTVLFGNFTAHHGVFNTQDMYIDSPVAHLSMQGSISMSAKSSDVEVSVKPHITSSLPILATIAGGPVVGAATWLAGKVVGESIDKISYFTYKIVGPWSKPEVAQINVVAKQDARGEN